MVAFISGLASFSFEWKTTPTSSLMPHCITMLRARLVAWRISDDAPLVTSSGPKIISSATLPPMHTSILAIICFREMLVWSPLGSCITMPSACPRGMMVALCTGSAPAVLMATSACPPSWYAVILAVSLLITAERRSAPIRILSFANSSAAMSTSFLSSTDALSAAWLMRLKRSAPDIPGVPRARVSKSTSFPITVFLLYSSRICLLPRMSGRGTAMCLSKRPGRVSASSRMSA
mmetsp:Transcript_7661/g.9551  ORF Transcript_7661/g.9551 Transcript_7661/m.9551 type:complete len:234 (+) Transcript_7661:456-1157(+)